MRLTGKIALITNVSEFMGPAITEEFCREGASVALHDRNEAAAVPMA
ncbi:MAG: short-chain dehydrogenase, partial [Candidatus Rokubacteria bacterium]|nr:short-chain dehydrogenase [Candidatus Rokubacteria bacterium]